MTHDIRIDGRTRLYAIVGDPIEQVRSPQTFTERFAALGANAILVPAHIRPDEFDRVFPALMALANLDGLLVTVPYKPRAIAFATRLGKTAQVIGAANALRREADGTWSGDMFDGLGFVRAAQGKGQRLAGRRVTLFGAGGAGSAIACALAEAGVASIDLVDPLPGRAEALAGRLRDAFPATRFAAAPGMQAGSDMVVNASTIGMRPDDGMPGEVPALPAGTLVGDVIVSEAPTALLRHAQQCGCAWVSGPEMHNGQAQAITDFFAPAARAA